MTRYVHGLSVLLGLVATAQVTAQERPQPRSITVSGHSQVNASPDIAELSIAVETAAATADAAIADNANRSVLVGAAIRARIRSDDTLTTSGYSLEPRYDNSKVGQSSEPKIVGYVARNEVKVEFRSLDQAGAIIDAAIEAGGNRVNHLNFTLSDRNQALRIALERAGAEAQAQAESIAKSLGVKLVRVLQANSSGMPLPQPRFKTYGLAAMEARAATPIEPGNVQVHATLDVTYEIE